MIRKEKQITEKSDIDAIIRQATVCRIGLSENNMPYIVPMCFGYQDNAIYLHGALRGKKIDILRKNQNVCFEFDSNTEIVGSERGCQWGMRYQSVIGFGKACFLEDPVHKREALNVIMSQYSDNAFQFPENAVIATSVIKIDITSMTGKTAGN